MAIAFESVATTPWASTSDITIAKPSGLAVGDLMVSQVVVETGLVSDITLPSGWAEVTSYDDGSRATRIGYKVADSSDTAATDFTFGTGGTNICGGAIMRISGAGSGHFTAGTTTTTSVVSSHTFTGGITPPYANSLLLFLVYTVNGSDNLDANSTYAITTDNPSWTEAYDFNTNALGTDFSMACAYATRTQTSATGNFTSQTGAPTSARGTLIAIAPAANATASPTVITATFTIQQPSINPTAAPTVVTMTVTLNAPTATVTASKWDNADKTSAATFANASKNAASASNASKSASSWTNASKT